MSDDEYMDLIMKHKTPDWLLERAGLKEKTMKDVEVELTCDNCGKKWVVFVPYAEFDAGVQEGIYFWNPRTELGEAESLCDACVAQMKQELKEEPK